MSQSFIKECYFKMVGPNAFKCGTNICCCVSWIPKHFPVFFFLQSNEPVSLTKLPGWTGWHRHLPSVAEVILRPFADVVHADDGQRVCPEVAGDAKQNKEAMGTMECNINDMSHFLKKIWKGTEKSGLIKSQLVANQMFQRCSYYTENYNSNIN